MKRFVMLCTVIMFILLLVVPVVGCQQQPAPTPAPTPAPSPPPAPTPPPAPAIFELSNLTISPREVECGESATIWVDIGNTAGAEGTYHVTLKIDGVQIGDQNVAVGPGATHSASFSVAKEEAGSYTIEVNGLTATLLVLKPAEFKMEALIISPSEVLASSSATVTVDVTNIGEAEGDCEVTLRVDDRDVETKKVTIAVGATKTVTFTLLEEEEGTYNLSVNGLSGTLTVVTPPTPPRPAIESLTYTNADYGFSVEYPKDWDVEEDLMGCVVFFAGPIAGEYDYMVNVSIQATELPIKVSAEDLAKMGELQEKKQFANYKKLGEQSTTIGGQTAIVRTISATMEVGGKEITLKDKVANFVKDKVAYVISYDVAEGSHDQYVNCFELVISTFKFE